jgi:hypothetical protein
MKDAKQRIAKPKTTIDSEKDDFVFSPQERLSIKGAWQ